MEEKRLESIEKWTANPFGQVSPTREEIKWMCGEIHRLRRDAALAWKGKAEMHDQINKLMVVVRRLQKEVNK